MHFILNQVQNESERLNARHELDWLHIFFRYLLGLLLQLYLLGYHSLKPIQHSVLRIVLLLLSIFNILNQVDKEHFDQLFLSLLHVVLVQKHELVQSLHVLSLLCFYRRHVIKQLVLLVQTGLGVLMVLL